MRAGFPAPRGRHRAGTTCHPKLGRLRFEEAKTDLLNDYRTNKKRLIEVVERRIVKHLEPYFGGRLMGNITTADVRRRHCETSVGLIVVRKARQRALEDGAVEGLPSDHQACLQRRDQPRADDTEADVQPCASGGQAVRQAAHSTPDENNAPRFLSIAIKSSPSSGIFRAAGRCHPVRLHHGLADPQRISCRSNGARWISRPAKFGWIRKRRRTATAVCSR